MKSVFMSLVIASMGFMSSAFAGELTGTCLLEVDGVSYLSSSHCYIDLEKDGSFSIGTNGKFAYFAYANQLNDGMHGYWNSDGQSHADTDAGLLKQEQITEKDGTVKKGGRWTNDHIKICAWK